MPNQIDANGLQVATRAELVAAFTAEMQSIYGADINLESNSPDGQMMNIFIQSVLDLEDLLVQIYNQFDPDNAIGEVLDQRVAINGIQRQAGTYTVTNISIVTTAALTLYGLDQTTQPVYTVSDNAGTEWELQTTTVISGAGTTVAAFRAKNPGQVLSTPNTITTPVTIVLGVASVNNPTTYTTLGINEESDAALKIRRQQAVSISSQGYLQGLLAALQNVSGVTSAFVHENTSADTDSSGLPGHSIWVIVDGSGADADIAAAIYAKRNAGCGMYGGTSYIITQADGSPFPVYWDEVTLQNVFIKFTASSLDGINAPNISVIKSYLTANLVPGVYEQLNINDLATLIQQADNNCLVTNAGFCLTVGGTYQNSLTPSFKYQKFSVSSANIIVLPMILSPVTANVLANGSQQMTPLGGYGTMTYSMVSNPSGGSVNASTGLYTAGATSGVSDVVRVTDSLGNTGDATISVV